MSHIAKVDIQFKDSNSLKEAAKRLGHKCEEVKNYRFYDGTVASGTVVYLPDWKYPVVIKDDGEAVYDNYNGHWGKQKELDQLKQIYGVEVAKKQARIKGYSCREVVQPDGKIKVFVTT
jgi:hypothetical protein